LFETTISTAGHRLLAGPTLSASREAGIEIGVSNILPGNGMPEARHQLTRFLMLRLLGLVYLVAFAVFLRQGPALIGHDGLLPADLFLDEVAAAYGSRAAAFWRLPSLFWLDCSDTALAVAGWTGALLSLAVVLGCTHAGVMAALWALYLSVTHVGQLFWGYAWETLLCETGFLAIFLCPLTSLRPLPARPPPPQVIWLFRWLTLRVMLGSGLIKLRSDPCWQDLTCLDFHFLTQPIPNPLSPLFHFAPGWVHVLGALFTFTAELVAPLGAFGPRAVRRACGAVIVAFQLVLILSGNLAYLNWLTLVAALACFDDAVFTRLVPARWRPAVEALAVTTEPSTSHLRVGRVLCVVVALLSIPPVLNLLSSRQRMNTSFEPFALVNSYGAFGGVGRVRHEIVLEGTHGPADGADADWRAYQLPCQPGDTDRRPCVISPYHLRLDWQIWFAAMSTADQEPWMWRLVWKLLHNDPRALGLLDRNPFPDRPPRFIRARLYRYELAPPGDPAWWRRELVGEWLPPLSADHPLFGESFTRH
jgi:hypothetical protein